MSPENSWWSDLWGLWFGDRKQWQFILVLPQSSGGLDSLESPTGHARFPFSQIHWSSVVPQVCAECRQWCVGVSYNHSLKYMVHQNQVKHNKPCQSATMNIHKARTLIEEFQVINFQPLKLAKKEENKWTNRKLQVFSSKKKKEGKNKRKITN